ncbi:MAG: PQQ-binding-like beta-propeller repeat protein, partial [Planctomycetaceae bacterium]
DMHDAGDESTHWLVPLRTRMRSGQGSQVAAQADGQQLIVLHQDVLHCLSPAERQVLWTRPLDVLAGASGFYRQPQREVLPPMQAASVLTGGNRFHPLSRQTAAGGMLAVANSEYLCVYGRRQITVLDPMTGEVRWTHGGLPLGTQVYGNRDVLFVRPENGSSSYALRALDGRRLEVPNLDELLAKTVLVADGGLVLLEERRSFSFFGLAGGKSVLHLFDPLAEKDRWKREYSIHAVFSQPGFTTLAALSPDGALELVDLRSGAATDLGTLTEDDLKSKVQSFVLLDRNYAYLIVNRSGGNGGRFHSTNLPVLQVNGGVLAFDRTSGRRLWSQDVRNHHLLWQHATASPVMLFAANGNVRKGDSYYGELRLLAIDRRTGETLLDDSYHSQYSSSLRWLDVNLRDRYIELRTYNQRIRLTAVSNEDAPAARPVSQRD